MSRFAFIRVRPIAALMMGVMTSSALADRTLVSEAVIAAPPADVWKAFTTSEGFESWAVAHVLGSKQVPNRVDDWGPHYPHDWHTWWQMLPVYLDELAP